MINHSSLSQYAQVTNEMRQAKARAEQLEAQHDEMTTGLLNEVMSYLNPGEGMTARQISNTLEGVLDSYEVASRMRSYGVNCDYQQETVPMYFRETDANGNILPGGRVYCHNTRVNVYRKKNPGICR